MKPGGGHVEASAANASGRRTASRHDHHLEVVDTAFWEPVEPCRFQALVPRPGHQKRHRWLPVCHASPAPAEGLIIRFTNGDAWEPRAALRVGQFRWRFQRDGICGQHQSQTSELPTHSRRQPQTRLSSRVWPSQPSAPRISHKARPPTPRGSAASSPSRSLGCGDDVLKGALVPGTGSTVQSLHEQHGWPSQWA